LEDVTGNKWTLDILPGNLGMTLADVETAQKENDKKNVAETPLVKAILDEFNGAKIETLAKKTEESEDNIFDDNEDFFINED
jgi:hypothetical protein